MKRNHIGTITTSETVKEWKGMAALTTAIVAVIVLAGVCMGVDAFGVLEYAFGVWTVSVAATWFVAVITTRR